MIDTPMLRDQYRNIRSEAFLFLGVTADNRTFNTMVKDEMKFLEMEEKPTNFVTAAEIVLHNLALLDAEEDVQPEPFDLGDR